MFVPQAQKRDHLCLIMRENVGKGDPVAFFAFFIHTFIRSSFGEEGEVADLIRRT